MFPQYIDYLTMSTYIYLKKPRFKNKKLKNNYNICQSNKLLILISMWHNYMNAYVFLYINIYLKKKENEEMEIIFRK